MKFAWHQGFWSSFYITSGENLLIPMMLLVLIFPGIYGNRRGWHYVLTFYVLAFCVLLAADIIRCLRSYWHSGDWTLSVNKTGLVLDGRLKLDWTEIKTIRARKFAIWFDRDSMIRFHWRWSPPRPRTWTVGVPHKIIDDAKLAKLEQWYLDANRLAAEKAAKAARRKSS
ncbi:MAG: hypothetical protein LBM73_02385 [Candidatus Nomurabacteria bacterium]|jgi:hypothetical protein|nr:hypothetical protein [Candidatus Nomurabacteria bacterium]